MDMDISMDIHAKSVDMDMDMDWKFHIHGNPGSLRHTVFPDNYPEKPQSDITKTKNFRR